LRSMTGTNGARRALNVLDGALASSDIDGYWDQRCGSALVNET
jgi:hypothetical protein